MTNINKKLLIFDFDGTLIDSAEDYLIAVNRLAQEMSLPEFNRKDIEIGLGHGLKAMMKKLIPAEDLLTFDNHAFELKFARYYKEIAGQNTKLFPYVDDFLQAWPGQLALVTNKTYEPTKLLMKHLNLDKYNWVRVLGYDSLPAAKPNPLPLVESISAARVQPAESVMIGDGSPDIQAAHNAGIDSIAVTFGYGKLEILKELKPSRFLRSYKDLEEVLVSLNR